MAAAWLCPALMGIPVAAQTMTEVVGHALSTNPRILALVQSREAAIHDLRGARALYLPQIDVAMGTGLQRADNLTTRGTAPVSSTRFYRHDEASLQLMQTLFDGYDADSQVERQKARVLSATNRVTEDSEALALEVATAYLEILRQRRLMDLDRNNIQQHRQIVASIHSREEQGAGNSGDVTQAEGRLQRALAAESQTEGDLRDANAFYQRLTGEIPGNLVEPPLPATHLPSSLTEALAVVKTSNPSVRVVESDIVVAREELENTSSLFYPKVTGEVSSIWDDTSNGTTGRDRTNQIMLRLRWALYRGGGDVATRDAARSHWAGAESQRDKVVLDSEEKLRQAWEARGNDQKKIAVFERAAKLGTETLETYKQQFDIMIRTLVDVLNVENELYTTNTQLASARIDYLEANYRILGICGRLLPALGIAGPTDGEETTTSFDHYPLASTHDNVLVVSASPEPSLAADLPTPSQPPPDATARANSREIPVPSPAIPRPAPPPPDPSAGDHETRAKPAVGAPATAAGDESVHLQLGSAPTEAEVRDDWQRLEKRYPEVLDGFTASVVRADLGERGIHYRLHIGPMDEARAHTICEHLKSLKTGCLLLRS